jgi:hypothetical protein
VWTEFLSFLLFFCFEFKSPSGTVSARLRRVALKEKE